MVYSLLPKTQNPKVYSNANFPAVSRVVAPTFTSLTVTPNSNNIFSVSPSFVSFVSDSPNIESSRVETSGSALNGGVFRGKVARGVVGTPTQALSGDTALFLDGFAYANDVSSYVRLGSIQIIANQNIDNNARGSYISLKTIANDTSTNVESMRIAGNGDVSLSKNNAKLLFNDNKIRIGSGAGNTNQGTNTVAIGTNAGNTGQGNNSIAIGNVSGQTSQHDNTIILNASGTALNSTSTNSTYIKTIRGVAHGLGVGVMRYDSTTGEVTYSTN